MSVRSLEGLQTPGETGEVLYRYFDSLGRLLYVGITCNPRQRQTAHRTHSGWWRFRDPGRDSMEEYPTRAEVEYREAVAILEEKPKFNRAIPSVERLLELSSRVSDNDATLTLLRKALMRSREECADARYQMEAMKAQRDHLRRRLREVGEAAWLRNWDAKVADKYRERPHPSNPGSEAWAAARREARDANAIVESLAKAIPIPHGAGSIAKRKQWILDAAAFLDQMDLTAVERGLIRRPLAKRLEQHQWRSWRFHGDAIAYLTGFTQRERLDRERMLRRRRSALESAVAAERDDSFLHRAAVAELEAELEAGRPALRE